MTHADVLIDWDYAAGARPCSTWAAGRECGPWARGEAWLLARYFGQAPDAALMPGTGR